MANDETEDTAIKLIKQTYDEIFATVKGFYCDGEPEVLKAICKLFPQTPIQLCVFHKYTRIKQIILFIYPKKNWTKKSENELKKKQ